MSELRQKFEETNFYQTTLLDIAKPYIFFKHNEYKGHRNFQSLVIRLNSGFNVFKEQQTKIDELQKRVDEVCDLLDRAEVNHKHLLTKYQSTKAMEMSSSKMLSRVDQILNALNESMKDFKEMDLYDKGYRVAVGYVIADLEKALRGENDQSN